MPGKQYDPEFKRKVAREVVTGLKRPAQAPRGRALGDAIERSLVSCVCSFTRPQFDHMPVDP